MEQRWRSLAGCSPGFGKSEGRVSINLFIICMAVSSAKRRGNNESPWKGKQKRGKNKEGKS